MRTAIFRIEVARRNAIAVPAAAITEVSTPGTAEQVRAYEDGVLKTGINVSNEQAEVRASPQEPMLF
eukprot:185977-Amphidinium_carterae.1